LLLRQALLQRRLGLSALPLWLARRLTRPLRPRAALRLIGPLTWRLRLSGALRRICWGLLLALPVGNGWQRRLSRLPGQSVRPPRRLRT